MLKQGVPHAGPESRRRFLDMDHSQVYKSYFYALTRYNKALLSRNNLLKQGYGRDVTDMLFPYDVQLCRDLPGTKIDGKQKSLSAGLRKSHETLVIFPVFVL